MTNLQNFGQQRMANGFYAQFRFGAGVVPNAQYGQFPMYVFFVLLNN